MSSSPQFSPSPNHPTHRHFTTAHKAVWVKVHPTTETCSGPHSKMNKVELSCLSGLYTVGSKHNSQLHSPICASLRDSLQPVLQLERAAVTLRALSCCLSFSVLPYCSLLFPLQVLHHLPIPKSYTLKTLLKTISWVPLYDFMLSDQVLIVHCLVLLSTLIARKSLQ